MANIINGTDTGSGGLITTGDSSDELQLQTAETARVTLTNTAVVVNEDGNDVDFRVEGDTDANLLFVDAGTDRVGVGTNAFSPSSKMQVNVSTTTPSSGSPTSNSTFSIRGGTTTVGDGPILELANVSGAKETLWKISAVTVSGNNGDLAFHGYAGGATFPERMRILSSGGITFNGDTAAANALDDYEEGDFDPTAEGDTTAGTCSYSLRVGRYTKIGRLVTFQLTVGWSGHTGTGTLLIGSLPFTAISGIQGQSVASLGYNNGLSYTSVLQMYIAAGGTRIVFVQSTTGGSLSGIPVDASVAELVISGQYITT